MSQHFQQNGNDNNGPILPMINRNTMKPFRGMASWTKDKRRSSVIGCICLLISNTIFLILAIIFAVLYFVRSNQNGSADAQFAGGNNGDFNGSKLANWNSPTTSLFGQYSQAAVAADQEICSNIGRGILLKGGNAVDAVIATQFCIGIMDTHSAGLGGGHLMTIFNATTKKCHVVDAREIAPLDSTEDMFVGIGREGKSEKGWESIAVPGELHGYWTEYTNFGGNVDWKSLVEPTINLVQEGYPTSHALAGYLRSKREQILARPSMVKRFINPETGNIFLPGEQIKTRQDLLETLKKLANTADPVELFYRGELAKSMVDEFQMNGGRLTLDDFANYKAKMRNDSQVIYTRLSGGRTICGPPPPSGSTVTQAIINILDTIPFDLSTFSGRVEYLHYYIEASRFAYAARNQLGDLDFVPEALELARNITSREWAEYIRSKITWSTHNDEYYDEGIPREFHEDHGTAHVSVVDKWGNAVAITSSLNLAFGSMEFSDTTGILFNDQMDDFSTPGKSNYWGFPPSSKNFIRPGKRPMSSMSPIVVFNENSKEVLAIGGSGGSTIISGVAEATYNAFWLGMSIKEAIDFPRLHNQLRPNITATEGRMPPKEYLDALTQRGHWFAPSKEGPIFNVVSGVHRLKDGTIRANSDFRKGWESQPAGY